MTAKMDDVTRTPAGIPSAGHAGRSAAGCCLAVPAALVAFGLTLALLTAPAFGSRPAFELAATFIAAAVGFATGGYVAGWIAGRRQGLHGGIFGLLFGFFSSIYVLGPRWLALPAGLACAGLGLAGGWMASTWRPLGGSRPAGGADRADAWR